METVRSEGLKPNLEGPVFNIPDNFTWDSEAHKAEVIGIFEGEIKLGADEIRIFGSRAKGTHRPNASDTDVLVINNRADGKRIKFDERLGTPLYFGKEPGKPGVHVSRVTEKMKRDRFNDKRDQLRQALKGSILVWKRSDEPK